MIIHGAAKGRYMGKWTLPYSVAALQTDTAFLQTFKGNVSSSTASLEIDTERMLGQVC